jgi:hypothetical protein
MVNPEEILAAALRYAALGYKVFPCRPGDKRPITRRGFHDASTDREQITRWWAEHPHANIGIAAEGLLVIDVDGADNTWPGSPGRSADLAGAGARAVTPRGGTHYIFRRPAGTEWQCSVGRVAPGVDVRTDGGYFVAAPSEVGDTAYRWIEGMELDVTPNQLPLPPDWLTQALDQPRAAYQPDLPVEDSTAGDAPATDAPPTAPADANIIPEGQRNATLARLAGSMRRVGMGREEIAAALHLTNWNRCRPPLADREVARIAESIARYAPDQVSVALVEDHYGQMQAEQDEADNEPAPGDPGPVPERLFRVPGLIGEVMAYTLDTAPYPEPVLAFAGALALQALLAGRKVRDEMGNRTNLYILNLANSGAGKDHARKVNARILYESGLADCLGTGFASGEGIEDRLFVQPATLFQVDEIDGLLMRVGLAKDARHEAIVSMLLQMYSSAGSVYVMRARANQARTVIDQPCLCLFGTAVPKHFYEALSARMMTNGFLARLLILECRARGRGREVTEQPIPAPIVEAARWWADFRPGGNLAAQHPATRLVSQTPEAGAVFRDFRMRADAEYSHAESRGDAAGMAIWARSYEKARRLALIYACSADRANPVITAEAAAWAGELIEHQTRRMIYMAGHHACESEFDGKRKRLLDVLDQWRQQHGEEWMPFWRINRKLPWSRREHEEVRDTLIQQRLIEFRHLLPGLQGGRPGMCYRLLNSLQRP